MSYRALVDLFINFNMDFLSNFQSLIETLNFFRHISTFRAEDLLTGRGARKIAPRGPPDFSGASSCIVLHAEFGRNNEKVRNGRSVAQSDQFPDPKIENVDPQISPGQAFLRHEY